MAQGWFVVHGPKTSLPSDRRAAEILFIDVPNAITLLGGFFISLAASWEALQSWHPRVRLLKPLAVLGSSVAIFLAWLGALSQ